MLKYRVIRAFVAVWCALCVSYAGVRAVIGAVLGKTDVVEEVASVDESTDSEGVISPQADPAEDVSIDEPTVAEPSNDAEALGDKTDGWTQENTTPDIPSLNEYLSWYTCGSCRRNCSLANPRCHNGSRLAQIKAQEYYEMYG